MEFGLTTVAAILLLFAAASCAPARRSSLQDACEDVRGSSLKLNQIAKMISLEARNGSKYMKNFPTSLLWMEANDMCDPGNLKQKTGPCIEKILDVLTKYSSALDTVAQFESCSEFADRVKTALLNLTNNLSECVKSRGEMNHHQGSNISEGETQPIAHWQEALLCHYTFDRLFSFSIFTARVFAVGDPANHTDGSAQRCM